LLDCFFLFWFFLGADSFRSTHIESNFDVVRLTGSTSWGCSGCSTQKVDGNRSVDGGAHEVAIKDVAIKDVAQDWNKSAVLIVRQKETGNMGTEHTQHHTQMYMKHKEK
jgi:hypothetical protein